MNIEWIKETSIQIDIFMIGMTFMMLFYYVARSFLARGTDYRLYAMYLLTMNIFIIGMFYYNTYHVQTDPPSYVRQFYRILIVCSQVISYIFYFKFVSKFLNLRKTLPEIYSFFSIVNKILILYIGIFILLVYFTSSSYAASISFDIIRLLLIASSLYAMVKAYYLKNPLTNYFIAGNGLYLLFAVVAWIFNLIPEQLSTFFLFTKIFFGGLQVPVILESLCFALGLSYKDSLLEKEKNQIQEKLIQSLETSNQLQRVFAQQLEEQVKDQTEKVIQLQTEKFMYEKEQAIQSERGRIARDMHDDLGSGLSAIHLLSNNVKENALEKYPEFSSEIDKIRSSSEDLNQAIREIIWTVNTKDDTLQSLVQFIQRYSHEMHEKTRIPVYVHVPDPMPNIPLNGVQRKNLYLCLKESVNNAIKHANPSKVDVFINTDQDTSITLIIKDDGQGIAKAESSWTGNGMTNMKDRIADIGGRMEIESGESGTEVRFVFTA